MAAIVVALGLFCYCAFGSLTLKNYDNDPNLARGMEYDLGESGVDYDKADRAKVEKYYLEYLKNVQESFQKARVYARLGVLYATGFDVRKGEKADYDKARIYFKKALELEPERIDYTTIQARSMLASMHESGSDRVNARMEVYEWLKSINEEKINQLWLPQTPGEQHPNERLILHSKKLVANLPSSLETNIMGGIKHLPEAEAQQYLLEIVDRFAGTDLEKLARKHAAERGFSLGEEVEKPREEKGSEEVLDPAWAYRLLAGIIGIGVLTAVLLLKKKSSSRAK